MNEAVLQNAWRLHQAGKLAEAERLYKDVLRASPNHVGALQMLSYLHFQSGALEEAERTMAQVVRLVPNSVDAHYNRGCALQAMNRHKEALASFDRALALNPSYGPALTTRGNSLAQMGRFEDALASYDLGFALTPPSAEALLNRGNTLFELRRHAEALASYDKALGAEPRVPMLWNNRGNALMEMGRPADALASFEKALALDRAYRDAAENRAYALASLGRSQDALAAFDALVAAEPGNLDARIQKGVQLKALKRAGEALACFAAVLSQAPQRADAHILAGNTLIDLKEYEDAVSAFDAAIAINPRNATAWSNRASALLRLKRPQEALASAEKALAIDPAHADAWHNKAGALGNAERRMEALDAYERAISLNPESAVTRVNRGDVLIALKRDDDAIADFEAALAIDPRNVEAHSGRARAFQGLKRFPDAAAEAEAALAIAPENTQALHVAVHARLHSCDWSRLDSDRARVREGLAKGLIAIPPFDWKALSDSESEHLHCTRLWATEQYPPAEPLWRGETYRHDKIRIAYLSTDFRDHAVAFLIAGVFEHHDKAHFETTGISFGPDDGRETRKRIAAAFDRFIDARTMTNAEVAAYLRANEIDIAIDLNGFTGDARTGILAMRPAPVQVNYLGYPGTMGAPYIDYIIADRIVIPEENRAHYSEKIVYLPDQYQANDRSRRIAARTPTRAEAGLPQSGFVFCSFNTNYKILPPAFDIWMRLLREVDGSVLWLLDDNRYSVANLKREATARGIAPERLVFAPRRHHEEYLAQQRLADLFLDTLPYNAHTTASDALWAGLPVLTCIGKTFPGRVAASLLTAAGLPELIVGNHVDYEAMALALARDPVRLAGLKAKLAANRATCALFDTAAITRHLETAYAAMCERQRNGLPPESFTVERH